MNVSECELAKLVAWDNLPIYLFVVVADSSVLLSHLAIAYLIMRCKVRPRFLLIS